MIFISLETFLLFFLQKLSDIKSVCSAWRCFLRSQICDALRKSASHPHSHGWWLSESAPSFNSYQAKIVHAARAWSNLSTPMRQRFSTQWTLDLAFSQLSGELFSAQNTRSSVFTAIWQRFAALWTSDLACSQLSGEEFLRSQRLI